MSDSTGLSIMISSMPKSGTTWMYYLLRDITGNADVRLYGDPKTGSEIDTARIIDAHKNHSPGLQ